MGPGDTATYGEVETSMGVPLDAAFLLASSVWSPREGSKWGFTWEGKLAGCTFISVLLAVVLGELGGEREMGDMVSTSDCNFDSNTSPFFAPSSLLPPSSSSSELMFSMPSWPLLSCFGAGGRGGKGGGAS